MASTFSPTGNVAALGGNRPDISGLMDNGDSRRESHIHEPTHRVLGHDSDRGDHVVGILELSHRE